MTLDYPWTEPPAPADVREVAPGVHWLRMPLPFQLNHINLWLLEDGDGWAIVDTGVGLPTVARLVGSDLRRPPRRTAGDPRDRHALPSRPHGQRRLADRALADRALVRAGRVVGRPGRVAQPAATATRAALAHYRRNGCGPEALVAARPGAAITIRAWCPTVSAEFRRDRRRRRADDRRPALRSMIVATATRPSTPRSGATRRAAC